MSEYINTYCDTDNVSCSLIHDLNYEKANDKILILDEVDLMIEQYAALFTTIDAKLNIIEYRGIAAAMHSKKNYTLSATIE